jgi:N-acetylmuramoyl-L-alanine amidase
MAKYTIGASADYQEILQLRNELQPTFSDCFIIAFKDGVKINTAEAIREYKRNQNK